MQEPGPSSAYYSRFAPTSNGPIRPPSPPGSPLLNSTDPLTSVDSLQTDSLYAILNVERDASNSEIRDRYRALAAVFHPDRQRTAADKAAAHERFKDIQRAYEVLSDPSRRIVYDQFGEEGLRTSWDLGPRNMSPDELRRHFAKQILEQKQLEAEGLVKPRGGITTMVDARAVFLSKDAFEDPNMIAHDVISRIRRIGVARVSMDHSFEMPLGDKTQVVVKGAASNRRGKGGANVVGTVRHQFSPRLWGQASYTLLNPRTFDAKATYVHDENTYLTVRAVQSVLAAPPRLSVSLGRKLYAETTGFMTYKTGFYTLGPWGAQLPARLALADQSALSIGMTTARADASGWTAETQAGLVDSHISADWSTSLLGLRVKVGASAGTTDGITGFVDAEGKTTQHVRTGMTLQLDLSGGVTMTLRWAATVLTPEKHTKSTRFSRLGQRITLPVMLTHDLNPYVLFGVTVVPAVGYLAAHRYIIQPRKRRQIADRVKDLRKNHADYISEKRKEALEAVSVMQAATAKKAAAEREKNGLVIIEAYYGCAECFTDRGMKERDSDSDDQHESYIDVTIPIQALVNDSTLVIPGGRGKYHLLGLYDPCIGENKKLRVRYSFRGRVHQVTVDDTVGLRAPLKAHLCDP
ncbi:hypothetical protein DB88DRAFT_5933 [Papiliotrema laurentii]|uniref:J domain-containing protein n=1 Tax=Papiliotrema laurentii TaxID=5418 RepID=A0AAD9FVG0_PAPLA|nr:hypothetical protein DB88DRAFT_5933 [Papiliotrema laurentii]